MKNKFLKLILVFAILIGLPLLAWAAILSVTQGGTQNGSFPTNQVIMSSSTTSTSSLISVAVVPIVNGGTGTTTPGLIAGTNITLSGSFPFQTINASGGGGSSATTTINGLSTVNYTFIATTTEASSYGIATVSPGTLLFNIPIASASNTGQLQSADWTTFNNKLGSYNVISANGLISVATTTSLATLTASTSPTFTGTLSVIGTSTLATTTISQLTLGDGLKSTFLATDPNGKVIATTTPSGGGTPGGSNTDVQYNNSGSFGGSPKLTFLPNSIIPNEQDLVLGQATDTLVSAVDSIDDYTQLTLNSSGGAYANLTVQQGSSTLTLNGGGTLILFPGELQNTGGALYLQTGGSFGANLNTSLLTSDQTVSFPNATGNFAMASTSAAGLWQSFTNNTLSLGSSTPMGKLTVVGNSGSTTPTFVVASSTNSVLLQVASNGSTTLSTLGAGCVNSTSGGSLFTAACASGGSGSISTSTTAQIGKVATWTGLATLGNGSLWDNGTVAGVNATSSTVNFLVQGTSTLNPFQVSSSSSSAYLAVLANGTVDINTTSNFSTFFIEGKNGQNSFGISSSTGANVFSINQFGTTTISSLTAGCVNSTSGGALFVNTCATGTLSGNGTNGQVPYYTAPTVLTSAADFLNNGTILGVNATSSTVNFNIQGSAGIATVFNIASTSGASMLAVTNTGLVTLQPTATSTAFQILNPSGQQTLVVDQTASLPGLNVNAATSTQIASLYVVGTTASSTAPIFMAASSSNQSTFQVNANGLTGVYGGLYGFSSTPSFATSTGIGGTTASSVTLAGSNTAGTLSLTTATAPGTSAAIVIVTLANNISYPNKVICNLEPNNANTALLSGTSMIYLTQTANTWTLNSGSVALTGATSYAWNYNCSGY